MKTKRKKSVRKQLTAGLLVLGMGVALPLVAGEHSKTSKSVPNVHYEMVPHVVLPETIQYNPVARSQNQLSSHSLNDAPNNGMSSPFVAKYTAFPSYQLPFPSEMKGVNQAVYPVSPKMLPQPLPQAKTEPQSEQPKDDLKTELLFESLQTKSDTKTIVDSKTILLAGNNEEIVTATNSSDEAAEISQTGLFCGSSTPRTPQAWSFSSPLFKVSSVPMVPGMGGGNGMINHQGLRGCSTNVSFPMGGMPGMPGMMPPMPNGAQFYTLPNGYSVMSMPSAHNGCGLLRCRQPGPQMMVFPPGMGGPMPQQAPQAPADPVSMMMMQQMQMQAMPPQPITAMTPYGMMVVGYQQPAMNPMMGMGNASPFQNVSYGGPNPMMGQMNPMMGMNPMLGQMNGMMGMPGAAMMAPNGMMVPPAYAMQIQQLQMQLMQLQQQNQQLKQQGKSTKVVETGNDKDTVAGNDLQTPMSLNPQLAQWQQIQLMQQQQMSEANGAYGQQFGQQQDGADANDSNAAMKQMLAANPYMAMGMNNLSTAGANPMMNPMMAGMNPYMNPMMMGMMNPMMNPMMVGMNPYMNPMMMGMNPYMNPMMMGMNPYMNPMFVGANAGTPSPCGPSMQGGGLTMSDVIQLMAIMKDNQPRRQGLFRRIFSRLRERRQANDCCQNDMMQQMMQGWCTPYNPTDTSMTMPSRVAYPYGYFGAQVGPQQTANYGGYYNLYMGNTTYPGLY